MFDPTTAVFTPAQKSTFGIERIKLMEKNKHRAMPLPLDGVGNGGYFADLMPGDLCAVQAQTSNYKSGFMGWWGRELAKHLAQHERDEEIIIHVDTENVIETIAIEDIARNSGHTVADLSRGNVRNWGEIIRAAGTVAGVQVYTIASALGTDTMPELYLSNIYRGIRHLVSGDMMGRPLQPACVFVDYLQALPIDPEVREGSKEIKNQRRLQVRQDVYRLRQMGAHLQCPVVVGVQAKQTLAGHGGVNMRIPGTYDGEETSSIAQRFDRVLGLWMPKTTHTVGETLQHRGLFFDVTERLIWLKVNKQRGRLPAGRSWQLDIDYRTGRITTMINP